MKTSIDLLKKLIKKISVSGYEWEDSLPQIIKDELIDEGIRIGDNLVFTRGNGKKKIFVSAHMDEVGFFISTIKKDYIRVMPIGEISIKYCIGKRLIFEINGKRVTSKKIKQTKSFSSLKVYGITNPQLGSVGTFEKNISISKDIITSPSLDNKVGCLVLLETLKAVKLSKDKTFIFCFACREEISLNGVMEAIRVINPDICIDIDSAYALPITSSKDKSHWQIPTIGNGPAIQLMGNGFIIRSNNRRFIESVAQKNEISYQYEIPDGESGGTNASVIIANGYDTMQINVPVADQHSAESRVSIKDITTTTTLLKKILEAL